MKKLIFVISLCYFSFNVLAQKKVLKDVAATQELSKKTTSLFSEYKITDLFKELIQYWPIPDNEVDLLEQKTLTQLNVIKDRFGKPIGIAKVNEETVLDFGIRETYLIRYENTALRLIITYYRNDKGWIINTFKWDDSFSLEFK